MHKSSVALLSRFAIGQALTIRAVGSSHGENDMANVLKEKPLCGCYISQGTDVTVTLSIAQLALI